jgi:protein-disulfide isomerase
MHSELMTSESWRIDTNWVALAVKVEISDTTRFSECLHADRTNDRLARSIALGRELGVNGTPTFVARKHRAVGQQTLESLATLE